MVATSGTIKGIFNGEALADDARQHLPELQ